MGQKKRKTQPANTAAPDPVPETGGTPWILIGGGVAVAAVAALALMPSGDDSAATPTADSTLAATATDEPALPAEPEAPTRPEAPPAPTETTPVPSADANMPPLPLVPNMVPRSPDVIRAAYTFAAQHPDVLEYVPCFCGCETAGHKGNADCFVQSRNPDGSVREWDTHGMACTICIDVARHAMQLSASGGSVRDIRTAVEATYSAYPRQTPTPTPPQ